MILINHLRFFSPLQHLTNHIQTIPQYLYQLYPKSRQLDEPYNSTIHRMQQHFELSQKKIKKKSRITILIE